MPAASGDTGRIRQALSPAAFRALEEHTAPYGRAGELAMITTVDRAHLVMLTQAGLLDRTSAGRILTAIGTLAADRFQALQDSAAPRGLYLLYEGWLIEQLGDAVGGALHTARSRNDLNATVLRLRIRQPVATLVAELLRLVALLLARGRRWSGVMMPLYTHYQAAVPGSYGHYLAAVAHPLQRSAAALLDCLRDGFGVCPLGGGAAAGTSLPIRPEVTARLLGFRAGVQNSLDAVASRDAALRVLGEAAILGVTLSRLATDLQLWTTAEFGFLRLPDTLVGSSSMMPQKRNPYLLEHVEGRAAQPLGALVAAATAMHAKPFANNIAAGTEAVAGLWDALAQITSGVRLARLMVLGAAPQPAAMRQRAEGAFLETTELCNRLVLAGMPFRAAHHLVGRAITETLARNPAAGSAAVIAAVQAAVPALDARGLDPAATMRASAFGGGPGATVGRNGLAPQIATLRAQHARLRACHRRWREAAVELDRAVAELCGGVNARPSSAASPFACPSETRQVST